MKDKPEKVSDCCGAKVISSIGYRMTVHDCSKCNKGCTPVTPVPAEGRRSRISEFTEKATNTGRHEPSLNERKLLDDIYLIWHDGTPIGNRDVKRVKQYATQRVEQERERMREWIKENEWGVYKENLTVLSVELLDFLNRENEQDNL